MEVNAQYQATRLTNMPFWNEIVCGDSAVLLRLIPSNSIDLVITSPPYFNQRDYGAGIGNETHVDEYIANLMVIFRECVRVIKRTGSIVFNLGDKYENRNLLLVPYRFALAAIAECDVRLVNHITWVKSNPTPRQFRRRLVSSTEPFFHFVKSDDYRYYIDEFLKRQKRYGANNNNRAGKNIGQSYFALIEKSALSEAQKHKARRALEEVIAEVKIGKIQSFRMKIRGVHSEPFGGQDGGRKIQLDRNGFTIIRIHGRPLKRDVIETSVEAIKGCPHPAIYPVQVVQEFLNLLTTPGDIVCDPFIGSGSTAVAAKQSGRVYIGFDINQEYCDYASARLRDLQYQHTFLDSQRKLRRYEEFTVAKSSSMAFYQRSSITYD